MVPKLFDYLELIPHVFLPYCALRRGSFVVNLDPTCHSLFLALLSINGSLNDELCSSYLHVITMRFSLTELYFENIDFQSCTLILHEPSSLKVRS